jgi:hypothetical protein
MIRTEGIPIVAARLAAAQRAMSVLGRRTTRRVAKIAAARRATPVIRLVPETTTKVAWGLEVGT